MKTERLATSPHGYTFFSQHQVSEQLWLEVLNTKFTAKLECWNDLAVKYRFGEHMKQLTRCNNAKNNLNSGSPITNGGRPPLLDPQTAMERALQASAVVEHASTVIKLFNQEFCTTKLIYGSDASRRHCIHDTS
ncbi:hypothetical protein M513_07246 [Trichuris suis]|uniref:Uncharacterized protein n=1 Tax=Trichuris suis TaxID=68888 RepID=A0A085M3X1_9BILA|nr:hypothetical protein M513_07246 [Trichuris suis]